MNELQKAEALFASMLKQTVKEIDVIQAQKNANAKKQSGRDGLMPEFLSSLASIIDQPDEVEPSDEWDAQPIRNEDIKAAIANYGTPKRFTFHP